MLPHHPLQNHYIILLRFLTSNSFDSCQSWFLLSHEKLILWISSYARFGQLFPVRIFCFSNGPPLLKINLINVPVLSDSCVCKWSDAPSLGKSMPQTGNLYGQCYSVSQLFFPIWHSHFLSLTFPSTASYPLPTAGPKSHSAVCIREGTLVSWASQLLDHWLKSVKDWKRL